MVPSMPFLTLSAPSSKYHIQAVDRTNREVASFAIARGTVLRLKPSRAQICTFKESSLSGTIRLHLHGQEIKVKQSWEGMRYGKDIEAPFGKLKLRPGEQEMEELRDEQGTLLARGKLPGMRDKQWFLEIFVSGNDFVADLILCTWVATMQGQDAENKQLGSVAEIAGAVAGV